VDLEAPLCPTRCSRAAPSSASGTALACWEWQSVVVITGTHAIIYASDADTARAFFRDVLELPNLDVHGGWLIFKLPPAELGIHPAGVPANAATGAPSGHHELYLMCDNVEATVADLAAKDVEFTAPVEEQGFGFLARLRVPGAGEIGLYQPKHPTAYDLDG
jgi:catechol 2,3-dioxygenase-like lactoylglutathione lyase family enzyme